MTEQCMSCSPLQADRVVKVMPLNTCTNNSTATHHWHQLEPKGLVVAENWAGLLRFLMPRCLIDWLHLQHLCLLLHRPWHLTGQQTGWLPLSRWWHSTRAPGGAHRCTGYACLHPRCQNIGEAAAIFIHPSNALGFRQHCSVQHDTLITHSYTAVQLA